MKWGYDSSCNNNNVKWDQDNSYSCNSVKRSNNRYNSIDLPVDNSVIVKMVLHLLPLLCTCMHLHVLTLKVMKKLLKYCNYTCEEVLHLCGVPSVI